MCLKRKRYDRGKKVASHHTGAEQRKWDSRAVNGDRDNCCSRIQQKKSKFSPKIRDIGSISSSQFLLQQTKFWFSIYVNHCGHINYFIAQNEAAE